MRWTILSRKKHCSTYGLYTLLPEKHTIDPRFSQLYCFDKLYFVLIFPITLMKKLLIVSRSPAPDLQYFRLHRLRLHLRITVFYCTVPGVLTGVEMAEEGVEATAGDTSGRADSASGPEHVNVA